jgi:hypothetical protein
VALQNTVSDVLLDGAHVITHIVHAIRLEERYERFLIHVVLLGELVHPNFAHSTRSTLTRLPTHTAHTAIRGGPCRDAQATLPAGPEILCV